MSVPLILLSLMGLGLFYFQNLVLFPQVHLSPLSLLVFYVGLKHPLPLALSLAGVMGLLEDSYALTPLGLHIIGSLILVAAARFFRRRFLLQHLGPQILASLGALTLQGLGFSLILFIIEPKSFLAQDWLIYQSLEILGTTALAPLMFSLLDSLEKIMRRWGWRIGRPAAPSPPVT
ncbi:MAG: rod shape-determining protein MreD [Deltaproteobacteria bacterium RBG_13_58_19]|nr:MAG: rod shape-determining protein MreD [Deltaproteobacteria bacterium RBG_13_58_19]